MFFILLRIHILIFISIVTLYSVQRNKFSHIIMFLLDLLN